MPPVTYPVSVSILSHNLWMCGTQPTETGAFQVSALGGLPELVEVIAQDSRADDEHTVGVFRVPAHA